MVCDVIPDAPVGLRCTPLNEIADNVDLGGFARADTMRQFLCDGYFTLCILCTPDSNKVARKPNMGHGKAIICLHCRTVSFFNIIKSTQIAAIAFVENTADPSMRSHQSSNRISQFRQSAWEENGGPVSRRTAVH